MQSVLIAILLVASCGLALGASGMEQLRRGFVDPGTDYRALPMEFDYDKPAEYGEKLVDGKWGGAHFNYPHGGPTYLQDPDGWAKFKASVQVCKEKGLNAWIYDEWGYPSGRAGGLVLKDHPEYESQGLFYDSLDVAAKAEKEVEWQLPKGTPYYVAICPVWTTGEIDGGQLTDITDKAKDGVLRTEVQPGTWRLMAFVQNRLFDGTHASITFGPQPNIMDPDATRRYIEVTHERYYAQCGDEFGKAVKAFFNDESSLMSGFLVAEKQPYPALPWYGGLPEIFSKRNGYDIRQALPAIFNYVGPSTPVKRCDFYSMISHQVADNYFRPITDWCKAHGVASTGHCLWEESLVYHAYFYGSIMPSLAGFDWPGIDVLGCGYGCTSGANTEGGPVTPKMIGSIAHLYDKKRTMSESFCFVKGTTPIEELLAHINWQWVLGINSLTTLSINDQYPADRFRLLNDYTGRLSYMLTQGRFTADVAVLYPIASVWTEIQPSSRHVSNQSDNPKAWDVNEAWLAVSRELLACRRDFDYLDEEVIEKARVSSGKISFGTNSYSILVLPHTTTLKLSTLKQIEKFVRGGGKVISYETLPSIREDAGPAEELQQIVSALWENGAKLKGKVLHAETPRQFETALGDCGRPDVEVSPSTREIYCQHRVLPNGDIYFLVNNSTDAVTGEFRFPASGRTEVWNPLTGETKPAMPKDGSVKLTIPGRGGLFVVMAR